VPATTPQPSPLLTHTHTPRAPHSTPVCRALQHRLLKQPRHIAPAGGGSERVVAVVLALSCVQCVCVVGRVAVLVRLLSCAAACEPCEVDRCCGGAEHAQLRCCRQTAARHHSPNTPGLSLTWMSPWYCREAVRMAVSMHTNQAHELGVSNRRRVTRTPRREHQQWRRTHGSTAITTCSGPAINNTDIHDHSRQTPARVSLQHGSAGVSGRHDGAAAAAGVALGAVAAACVRYAAGSPATC
jgi:hypothetical protein